MSGIADEQRPRGPGPIAGRAIPVGLVLLAMLSVQTGAALAKSLFPLVGAQGATALRVSLAAMILLAVWRPWRRPLNRAALPAILGFGVSLGLMNLVFYLCLRTIPLGVAVALEFTGPLALTLVHSRRALDFLWIALAAGGVLLLAPISPLSSALDPVGVGLALLAGVFWALYIVFGTRAGRIDRGQASALGMTIAALVAAPWGVAGAGAHLLAPNVLGLGLAVALLSSAIPYSLELVAMTALPTRTFGILMSLEPVVAAMAGLAILGERLAPLQWIAIAAVIAASAGSTATSRAPAPAEPAPN